ncbi:DapH/DapD/GlmU-related protein [Leptospira adleri]|uniref:DapH/DapD/GlmU-related protein n=1 Tax=Leptospira adleri TaxID=2023186 RepID=UPI0010843371|nr:DapH/DapD/GlmU-related protein [Leptospira adleri]TGM56507.1 transferase [Leptospira adleri]
MGIISKVKKYNILNLIAYGFSELWLYFIRWKSFFSFAIKAFYWNVSVGKNPSIFGKVIVSKFPGSEIQIGDNFISVSDSFRSSASSIFAPTRLKTLSPDAQILIGKNVGINGASITARSKTIKIGNNTMLAPNVTIMDSSFHALWPPEGRLTNPEFESDENVSVGDNVWVGSQVMILKGVTIGNNSVIGAGSLVTKSIPENCLAAGNPAKVIRILGQSK